MSESLGSAVLVLDANQGPLDAKLAAAEAATKGRLTAMAGRMKAVGTSLTSTGRKLTTHLTLPIIAAGAAIIATGSKFEENMSRIVGLVGVSRKQVDAWGEQIKRLAKVVGKSPDELAEAMFFIASAGFRGSEALDVLTASAEASAGGLGETKVIADAVTSAINAYGKGNLSASTATDILVGAVKEGKLEASELAPVLGQVLPVASALHIRFADVAGVLAAFSKTGTNAAKGATQLMAVMSALIKPAKQGESALQGVGLSYSKLRDVAAKPGGVIQVMRLLKDRFHGNIEEMAKVVPNVRALRGVMGILAQDGGEVDHVMKGVADSAGSTNKAFKVASEDGAFEMHQALADVQVGMIELYDVIKPIVIPAIKSIGEAIGDAAHWFSQLPESAQKIGLVLVAVAAAAGPVLMILGGLATAIGALLTPVAAFIAAGVLLAAGLVYLYETNKDFRDAVNALAGALGGLLGTIHQSAAAVGGMKGAFAPLVAIFKMLGPIAVEWVAGMLQQLRGAVQIIQGIVQVITGILTGDFGQAWEGVKNIFSGALTAILGMLRSLTAPFRSVASGIWSAVKGAISKTISFTLKLPKAMTGPAKAVWSAVKGIIEKVIAFHMKVSRDPLGSAKSLWNAVKGIVVRIIEFNVKITQDPIAAAEALWEKVKEIMSKGITLTIHVISDVGSLPGKVADALAGISKAGKEGKKLKDALAAIYRSLDRINSKGFDALVASAKALVSQIRLVMDVLSEIVSITEEVASLEISQAEEAKAGLEEQATSKGSEGGEEITDKEQEGIDAAQEGIGDLKAKRNQGIVEKLNALLDQQRAEVRAIEEAINRITEQAREVDKEISEVKAAEKVVKGKKASIEEALKKAKAKGKKAEEKLERQIERAEKRHDKAAVRRLKAMLKKQKERDQAHEDTLNEQIKAMNGSLRLAGKARKAAEKLRGELKTSLDELRQRLLDLVGATGRGGAIFATLMALAKLNAIPVDQLPHFATGTERFRGGLAEVGEKGPEIVGRGVANLAKGADVLNANMTRRLLGAHRRVVGGSSKPSAPRDDSALHRLADSIETLNETGTIDVIEALTQIVNERTGYKHVRGRRRTAGDGRVAIA